MHFLQDHPDATTKLTKSVTATKKQAQELSPETRRKSLFLNESSLDKELHHWSEVKVQGKKIQRRSYHTSVINGKSLYVYGGYEVNQGILQDFVTVDLDDNLPAFHWEEVEVKSQLKPAIAYKNKMYIYGGQVASLLNTAQFVAFDFTTKEWSHVTPVNSDPILPLDSHTAVLWEKDSENVSMILVGGFIGGKIGEYSNAVFEYKFKENEWHTLFKNKVIDHEHSQEAGIPQGRMSLGAAIYKTDLYIFGGNEGNTKFNDLWKFDLVGKKWSLVKNTSQTVPEARSGLTMVSHKDMLIVFGGILDITHEKNDIFVFSINKGTWSAAEQATKWVISSDEKSKSGVKKSAFAKTEVGNKLAALTSHPGKHHHHHSSASKFKSFQAEPEQASQHSDRSADASMSDRNKESPQKTKFAKLKLPTTFSNGSPAGKFVKGEGQGEDFGYQSTLAENQRKNKLLQKMVLLNEFEVTEEEARNLRAPTPATDSLIKSIKSLSVTPLAANEKFDHTAFLTGEIGLNKGGKKEEKIKGGVKPVGRDGHTATLMGNKMYVFAGDRHKMSFNDLFILDLTYFGNLY